MVNFIVFALFSSVFLASLRLNNAVPFGSSRDEASAGCKDERNDCDYIIKATGGGEKLQKYCNQWKDDAAVKKCRATCRMCKAPSPTECKDERTDCNWIVQNIGGGEKLKLYCKRYEDVAKQCSKTCNMCPKPPSPPTTEPETMAPETERPTQKPTTPTTKSKPTQSSHAEPTGFQRACLKAHNDYRFFHRSPPLTWSAELTRDAQVWANYLAATNLFEHDPTARPKGQGENLYYMAPPKRLCDLGETGHDCLSCEEIVQAWYDEELDYDYVTGKAKVKFAPILHFTQIVWKASTKLGMATAVANNRLVAVARYEPGGNIGGQFQENVLVPDFP